METTMGDKSVETHGNKIRFSSALDMTHSPPPVAPQTMLIFLGLHRPQRLHNTELGATLNWGQIKWNKCFNVKKTHFLKGCQLLLSLIVGLRE